MNLNLYFEHLTEEGKEKQLRHICITDFSQEIQGLINYVWNLGGRVMYNNNYGGYHAIVE
jgi:hypothetical protein